MGLVAGAAASMLLLLLLLLIGVGSQGRGVNGTWRVNRADL